MGSLTSPGLDSDGIFAPSFFAAMKVRCLAADFTYFPALRHKPPSDVRGAWQAGHSFDIFQFSLLSGSTWPPPYFPSHRLSEPYVPVIVSPAGHLQKTPRCISPTSGKPPFLTWGLIFPLCTFQPPRSGRSPCVVSNADMAVPPSRTPPSSRRLSATRAPDSFVLLFVFQRIPAYIPEFFP